MSLHLHISSFANAAFQDDYRAEVARILRHVAKAIEDGSEGGTLKDIDGNTVGHYDMVPPLLGYVVTYYEADDENMDNPLEFRCEAEDVDHAEEQCANAYPGCTTTTIDEVQ